MNDRPGGDGEDRHTRLAAATSPRRASATNAPDLARLLAAAFQNDPVMNWVARTGSGRAQGLERFFRWLLDVRAIPYGEVWMGGGAAAVWLPPGAPATAGGLLEQVRLFPMFLNLCGFSRLLRGQAIADAMEKHHPHESHFYLAFIGVEPGLQGTGLGSALLEATLRQVDEVRSPAYLENSNPKNTPLYTRHGFTAWGDIAPRGAPPVIAMWRPPSVAAGAGSSGRQGSRTMSQ